MSAESLQAFPTFEEIEASVPEGRLPYVKLGMSLDWMAGETHPDVLWGNVKVTINDLAEAANNTETPLEPPLSPELAGHLQRAAAFRSSTRHEAESDRRSYEGHDAMITEAGMLLLYAIADHGSAQRQERQQG